jgi:indole-3-glycerol phosphate synthase
MAEFSRESEGALVSATVLDEIVARTRADLEQRKRDLPVAQLALDESNREGTQPRQRFRDALSESGIAVIAEFKRHSPSAGRLREQADVGEIVSAYERGGAAALSVLTEGPHFEGTLEDLRQARAACRLPILRKDFIVDPYQLHEARSAGADAVLLIVAALPQATLRELHEQARELDLDVLVEVHDRAELEVALSVGADLIGVNNRDLRDFSVDVQRTARLLAEIPAGVAVVSESGISSAEQLRDLDVLGVQAVLVGELLMRAPDPEIALRGLQKF